MCIYLFIECGPFNTIPIYRVLWSIIPIVIFLFGAVLVYQLVRAFFEKPTVMIIDKPTSVQSIPFPGITFCHPQTVIDHKARLFVDKLYSSTV